MQMNPHSTSLGVLPGSTDPDSDLAIWTQFPNAGEFILQMSSFQSLLYTSLSRKEQELQHVKSDGALILL